MITELLPGEGTILCAVSGGADSMYLLERLRELGYPVAAAHYDHGLRGEASKADAAFVRDWCRERGVPFIGGAGDAAACARENRLGVEEAARKLRYAFLESAADALSAAVIATAHTADDNAETVVMRLTRGAGAKGLGGIPPVRGRLVRPMLDTTRGEVEAYLAARGIPHVEDETNAEDDYLRNRIRHRVIPLLREENPGFVDAVGRAARLLREDEEYLDGLAAAFLAENLRGDTLPADRLSALPRPVARRVLRRLAGDLSLRHVDALLALAASGVGAAGVPGLRVEASEGVMRFGAHGTAVLPEREVPVDGEVFLPEAGMLLRCKKNGVPADVVHKSFNTFLLSCENIYGTVRVTGRLPGDAYRPLGRGCTKTLKALFMESGVPAWERGRVPVLRDDRGILGVPGFPPAERCAAGPGDKDVLLLEFLPAGPGKNIE